jgi:hypothetical protein
MIHIKLFEKFTELDYSERKKKIEKKYSQKLIQKLGDKYIIDVVADGDFDGLKYLLDTGYIIEGDIICVLLVAALKNKQIEMFEWLLNNEVTINSISLRDIIGQHDYNNSNYVTTEMVEMLKIITEHGYDFDDNDNLIQLYLTEAVGHYPKTMYEFIEGVIPFIDWLLEYYPQNYKLCRDFLPDNLKIKYKYLEDSQKYNM